MKREYELLSGEKIDLSTLSLEEQGGISEIEKLIANQEDYLVVDNRLHALVLEERRIYSGKSLAQLYNSASYKILEDLLERYRQKVFR